MSKRSSSYEMDSTPLCDRYITETWYKVTNHIMTTSPPALGYCGTLYPVWLNGLQFLWFHIAYKNQIHSFVLTNLKLQMFSTKQLSFHHSDCIFNVDF